MQDIEDQDAEDKRGGEGKVIHRDLSFGEGSQKICFVACFVAYLKP